MSSIVSVLSFQLRKRTNRVAERKSPPQQNPPTLLEPDGRSPEAKIGSVICCNYPTPPSSLALVNELGPLSGRVPLQTPVPQRTNNPHLTVDCQCHELTLDLHMTTTSKLYSPPSRDFLFLYFYVCLAQRLPSLCSQGALNPPVYLKSLPLYTPPRAPGDSRG